MAVTFLFREFDSSFLTNMSGFFHEQKESGRSRKRDRTPLLAAKGNIKALRDGMRDFVTCPCATKEGSDDLLLI